MRAIMTVKDAVNLGVTVLHSAADQVLLGVFDVPALKLPIAIAPKGFNFAKTRHFYLPERAKLVEELLNEMDSNATRHDTFGVLLSGPNGVGKSGVGFGSFLCCMAQSRLVVYIPNAASWVEAAQRSHQEGDEYFLEQFFLQNADLIASTPALHKVFAQRLYGKPISMKMMQSLRNFLQKRPGPAAAVIVDEVQAITNAVAATSMLDAIQSAKSFFQSRWFNWTNNGYFVRMDIASSHGNREFNLPSGQENRLRWVHPWPLEIARAALLIKQSPVYVGSRPKVAERVLHVVGGVVRQLFRCQSTLPIAGRVTLRDINVMEEAVFTDMSRDLDNWFWAQLNEMDRLEVSKHLFPLLRGEMFWKPFKGAYDYGLVYKFGSSAMPVSPAAASVIHQAVSKLLKSTRCPDASSLNAAQRGYELENRVRAYLDPFNNVVHAFHMNGTSAPSLRVRVDRAICFDRLDETAMPSAMAVLYTPYDDQYPCDALIVSAVSGPYADCDIEELPTTSTAASAVPASDTTSKLSIRTEMDLQLWECSVTDPRSGDRLIKLEGWFQPNGFIDQVKAVHPSRRITIVLCWPEALQPSGHRSYQSLVQTTSQAGVSLVVVDKTVLESWGIKLSAPVIQL